MPYSIVDDPTYRPKTAYPGFSGVGSGYRYYSSELSRWLSRDPIEEMGGENLYRFVENNGLNAVDGLGQRFLVNPHPVWSYPGWGETKALGPAVVNMSVSQDSSCASEGGCWRLKFNSISMLVEYWYVKWRKDVQKHELLHVQDLEEIAYGETESYAKSKEGCYSSEDEANCWKGLMSTAAGKFLAKAEWLTIIRRHQPLSSEEQTGSAGDKAVYDILSDTLRDFENDCSSK